MQPAPVLEQEFLPLRAKLLEIGAALDRLDRADALGGCEPRAEKIRSAIETLLGPAGDRAERIQLVFSRPYKDNWRKKFRMTNGE
jgi:hypothetical protein